MDSQIILGIIKTYFSDHFAIFFTIKLNEKYHYSNPIFKRDISKDTISDFKYLFKNITWTDVWSNKNAREAYYS